jgi:hypothetical protein
LPALHALVDFQLELRQDGHDKEVTVEIGKRFLEQADLKLRIVVRFQ